MITTYEVETLPNGLVDVRRNGKAWKYDLDDIDEAMRYIRKKDGKNIKVKLFSPGGFDGYVRS